MTRVLLITDTERVLRIFESLETKEELQLRTASTLDQADLEISLTVPDFTFVQSRVSGFSGEIQLRHLRKVLPKGAKVILLAGDAVDAAQAKKEHSPFIDLTLGEAELAESVSKTLHEVRGKAPKKEATGDAAPAQVSSSVPEETPAPVPASVPETSAEPFIPEPPADLPARLTKMPVQEAPPADLPTPVKCRTRPFAELLELGTAEAGSPGPDRLHVEDWVSIGASPDAPTEGAHRSVGSYAQEAAHPLPEGYMRGIPLADAMANAERETRRYGWILPVLLAFLLIPLLSYVAGKKKAPVEPGPAPTGVSRQVNRQVKAAVPAAPKAATQAANPALSRALSTALNTVPTMSPAMLPAKAPTAPAPTTVPATAPIAKPEVRPAAIPEVKQAAKPLQEPEAKPTGKAGIKSLPSVVANAQLDSAYSKTHPGWQRYVDKKAEYTMFKEDNMFRAMQVIALGKETVPNQLFNTLLLEFGGTKRFHLHSAVDKGDYLMERGVANGGLSLTVYRRKKDFKVKGLVLYYP